MEKTILAQPEVIICCLISRGSSFLLDKFLANQQEIQRAYPPCKLLLTANDIDYAIELRKTLDSCHLKAEVITFETIRPDYAKSRLWDIACGREALRKYALTLKADWFLLLDTDMTYDTSIIQILLEKAEKSEVVFSGYRARLWNTLTYGAGCLLINRRVYERIRFRCIEFKNHLVFQEDELFEMDSFRAHARIKKGIFLENKHFKNTDEYNQIVPGPVGLLRRLTTLPFARYLLLKIEILTRFRFAEKIYSVILKKPL
jgi:hypothetical protein